jgi:hypothetical protein
LAQQSRAQDAGRSVEIKSADNGEMVAGLPECATAALAPLVGDCVGVG